MPAKKKIPKPDPFHDPEDKKEFQRFKKSMNSSTVYDVTQEEPSYMEAYRKYVVHRMDPRTAMTVVDSYYFKAKEAAQEAINFAKSQQK